ncbi:MAG: hypothetical protein ACK52I_20215 [Pseudomonadota bacterium]
MRGRRAQSGTDAAAAAAGSDAPPAGRAPKSLIRRDRPSPPVAISERSAGDHATLTTAEVALAGVARAQHDRGAGHGLSDGITRRARLRPTAEPGSAIP